MKKTVIILAAFIIIYLLPITVVKGPLTRLFGEARIFPPKVPAGVDIHAIYGMPGRHVDVDTRLSGSSGDLIRTWAARTLVDWDKYAKVTAPRIVLAKLMAGVDVTAVNEYLLAAEPNASSGSSWKWRPKGDYDFTEIVLASILFAFGDNPDLLWPETAEHIVDNLLIESGYRVRRTVPGSLGLVHDTENHILMTEGTRYLRNLWLMKHGMGDGNHVKKTARHAAWLAEFIEDLEHSGLYEFNSQPYGGYTVAALLILDAFVEDQTLQDAAGNLLDRLAYQFALADVELRRVVPFRRRLERANRTDFGEDSMTAMMIAWFDDEYGYHQIGRLKNHHHALIAAAMPYRPGQAVADELGVPKRSRLSLIGRGPKASPEIHAQGNGYMISAGGVSFGRSSGISARPTTLLLADGASSRDDCFSISGSGESASWNNTGVYLGFACGSGDVNIPADQKPIAASDGFMVYEPPGDSELLVLVYENEDASLLAVVEDWKRTPEELALFTSEANPDKNALVTRFAHPNGVLYTYDLQATAGTWVMKSVDGVELDRAYEKWPRLSFVSDS